MFIVIKVRERNWIKQTNQIMKRVVSLIVYRKSGHFQWRRTSPKVRASSILI